LINIIKGSSIFLLAIEVIKLQKNLRQVKILNILQKNSIGLILHFSNKLMKKWTQALKKKILIVKENF
jgi:hypothetical protein